MKGVVIVGHSVRFPHTITSNLTDETYCWLKQEVDAQHRTLSDYVRHIILTYKQAKEAKNKKGA